MILELYHGVQVCLDAEEGDHVNMLSFNYLKNLEKETKNPYIYMI